MSPSPRRADALGARQAHLDELPQAAYALALAGLPGAGPASLRAALEGLQPAAAWAAVVEGIVTRPSPGRSARPPAAATTTPLEGQLALEGTGPPSGGRRVAWVDYARRVDLGATWEHARTRGIGVTWRGHDAYPARLLDDPEAPAVLTWQGDLSCVDRPTVAVVGTRHCTPAGRAVAQQMGRELALAGVCVVSGLALGIDGAAHRGALGALAPGAPAADRPSGGVTAGVAASGVDVPYPRQHRALWDEVIRDGVVLSETPPGRPAQAWRFPARNRIIAGLADLVVVVESFEAGGALLTVDAALARGVEVCAVPGPVHSPAAAGTNRLLVDGAAPVRHAGDVLAGLGLTAPAAAGPVRQGAAARTGQLDADESRVLAAVGWAPTVLGRIVEGARAPVGVTLAALRRLEEAGVVTAGDAWWVRRGAE